MLDHNPFRDFKKLLSEAKEGVGYNLYAPPGGYEHIRGDRRRKVLDFIGARTPNERKDWEGAGVSEIDRARFDRAFNRLSPGVERILTTVTGDTEGLKRKEETHAKRIGKLSRKLKTLKRNAAKDSENPETPIQENFMNYLDEQLKNAYGFGIGDLTEEELGFVFSNLLEDRKYGVRGIYQGAKEVAAERGEAAGKSRERRIQTADALRERLGKKIVTAAREESIDGKLPAPVPDRHRRDEDRFNRSFAKSHLARGTAHGQDPRPPWLRYEGGGGRIVDRTAAEEADGERGSKKDS